MPDEKREKRILTASGLNIRAAEDAPTTIVGYAALFNVETDIAGYFREKVEPGAFADALRNSDVHALYNHDYGQVLGRAKSGTLRMAEDAKGLGVEIDLPHTQDALDLRTKIDRGDIDQMSFQFSMDGGVDEWDDTGDTPLRTIKQVGELFDVSVCPRGAYPTTECGLRSLDAFKRKSNFSAAQRRVRMKINLALRERENG